MLAVGIFPNGSYGAGWNLAVDDAGNPVEMLGLLYGGTGQFLAQLAGVVVIWTVMFGFAFLFFKIQSALTGGIRVSEEEELGGVDIPEMGVLAYPEFTGPSLEANEPPVISRV